MFSYAKMLGAGLAALLVALVVIEALRRRGVDLVGRPSTILSQRDVNGLPLAATTTENS
jgi:hypothetical protein